MHFRDVMLMGLCFGRLALERVGNFCVYQAKTWHQCSDNWLHLCKSVSVLLFRVLCLSVSEFFVVVFFSNTAWLCLCFTSRPAGKISRLSSRQISLLLTRHNDKALGQFIQFRHGIKRMNTCTQAHVGIRWHFTHYTLYKFSWIYLSQVILRWTHCGPFCGGAGNFNPADCHAGTFTNRNSGVEQTWVFSRREGPK